VDLAAARTELEERGFDSLSPARATMYLNYGMTALERVYPWPWLRTTTTGTSPLAIPDLQAVRSVRTSTGRELLGVDEQWLASSGYDFTQSGTAELWWLEGETTLKTWPVDSSTSLSVVYTRFSPTLSADGDTPLFNSRWDINWIDLSVVEAYRDSDDHDQAARLLAAVGSRLQAMIETYGYRNDQNPDLMVVRGESVDW
jgi:hypothetical protein